LSKEGLEKLLEKLRGDLKECQRRRDMEWAAMPFWQDYDRGRVSRETNPTAEQVKQYVKYHKLDGRISHLKETISLIQTLTGEQD